MNKGFTLAEVLITLAIIGVVAAITIPSVIVNTNQMEFKTGLRKAVSVLNQAITLNKALTGESPYDNDDLYNYLQQNMSVMRSRYLIFFAESGKTSNYTFYTTDGMRFEVPTGKENFSFPLYESDISILSSRQSGGNCGSLGLSHNPDSTTNAPCIMIVDVNGDRKPSPKIPSIVDSGGTISDSKGTFEYTRYNYMVMSGLSKDVYSYADPNGRLLTDIFSIMITDQGAIPYGVVAQKAMYQAQK